MKAKIILSELYIHYSIDPKDFTLHPIQATRANHIEKALERSKELVSPSYVHTLPFKEFVKESIKRAADATSPHDFTEIAEVLWDRHSEYIGEGIDDLQQVAGTTIMKRSEFITALTASPLVPVKDPNYSQLDAKADDDKAQAMGWK